MSVIWPHRVTVTAPPDTPIGAFNENDEWEEDAAPAPTVLYQGAANVTDSGRLTLGSKGGDLTREGLPVGTSGAVCYLKKKGAAKDIPPGSVVLIDWKDGTTSDAVVSGARRGDNSLELKRV